MKLEVTKRDKLLLSIILALLSGVICVFLGIMPLSRANRELAAQLESAQARLKERQRKLTGLAELKSAGEDLEAELLQVSEPLYPVMESQEIDWLLTEMILDCGLSVRRMEIRMPPRTSSESTGKESEENSWVFCAQVLLEITGSREDKEVLLDRIAGMPKGLRLVTMRRLKSGAGGEAGESRNETDIMELKLEISMSGKK